MRIRNTIQHFRSKQIRIKGSENPKNVNFAVGKKLIFWDLAIKKQKHFFHADPNSPTQHTKP
jgi:hypothetical protein